jgi:hypothetical protein
LPRKTLQDVEGAEHVDHVEGAREDDAEAARVGFGAVLCGAVLVSDSGSGGGCEAHSYHFRSSWSLSESQRHPLQG